MPGDAQEHALLSMLREEVVGLSSHRRTGQGVLDHPMVQAVDRQQLSPEQLKQFCQGRYFVASHFETLLEHAQRLASCDPSKKEVADALHRNLCDERGLEHAQASGAHAKWRADFLNVLAIEDHGQQRFPLYAFHDGDTLPLLVGGLLAAEFAVPTEDIRVLRALRKAFPDTFTDPLNPEAATQEQQRTTLYLEDHIRHDNAEHFPDLLRAVVQDFSSPEDMIQIKEGIRRFAAERKALYGHIQQQIDYTPVEQAARAL